MIEISNPDINEDKVLHFEAMLRAGVMPHEALGKLTQSPLNDALDKWITADQQMNTVKEYVRRISNSANSDPVLITGPTGTGKEVLARALKIYNEPFVAQNCGGLPDALMTSTFFGHKKGAFTGAIADSRGVLLEAGRGIIFLDEIADFPLDKQATLLRAIQESEIYPVGSVKPVPIECRFIAATKYNLEDRVEQGLFREDLYARLFTFELKLTGLEERADDIPLIAASLNWTDEIDPKFLPTIYRYNVRGIQTYVKRMKILYEHGLD